MLMVMLKIKTMVKRMMRMIEVMMGMIMMMIKVDDEDYNVADVHDKRRHWIYDRLSGSLSGRAAWLSVVLSIT